MSSSNKGSKKAGASTPAKKGGKAATTPKAPVWTPQDEAAKKIQTKARQFLAKKALERKKKEKQEYEELMNKLEHEVIFQNILITENNSF